MDFEKLRGKLIAKGYSTDTANAKIAHDVVIAAVKAAGFHDNLTVKGGVVMSGITNVVRRATMDMDVDFLRYSLADASIRKFVARLNRVSDCKIAISGAIKPLKQQEYKGKRIYLRVTDGFADMLPTDCLRSFPLYDIFHIRSALRALQHHPAQSASVQDR